MPCFAFFSFHFFFFQWNRTNRQQLHTSCRQHVTRLLLFCSMCMCGAKGQKNERWKRVVNFAVVVVVVLLAFHYSKRFIMAFNVLFSYFFSNEMSVRAECLSWFWFVAKSTMNKYKTARKHCCFVSFWGAKTIMCSKHAHSFLFFFKPIQFSV